MSLDYSKETKEHFFNPKNIGEIKNPDSIGKVGNPVCGDVMEIFLKINNNIIKDIKFRTFGCMAAIATSSMITELAKGKTLEKAKKIKIQDISDSLKGLPSIKMHCSNLAVKALNKAIENYENKKPL